MTMSRDQAPILAEQLLEARRRCEPIVALTEVHPHLTLADGFMVQRCQIDARLRAGEQIAGWKIGALSAASREQMGMTEPFLGPLFASEIVETGATIDSSRLIAPGAEPEIAFNIKERLSGPDATLDDAITAIEGAMAAMELVDCRFLNWAFKAPDIPADCGCTAGAVVSRNVVPLSEIALDLEGMNWHHNDELVATATGAEVSGSPLMLVPWLANKLAEWDMALEPGDIVLAGALAPHIKPTVGETLKATFTHLGSVTARFI